jgi:hypothetical protein
LCASFSTAATASAGVVGDVTGASGAGSGPHPTKTSGNNRTRNGFMDGLNLFG